MVKKNDVKNVTDVQFKIKDIICTVLKELEVLCEQLPAGRVKNIICGVIAILETICENIPLS